MTPLGFLVFHLLAAVVAFALLALAAGGEEG